MRFICRICGKVIYGNFESDARGFWHLGQCPPQDRTILVNPPFTIDEYNLAKKK